MLTGCSEPQQNRNFLMLFGILNSKLKSPFRNIEMQTTGTIIDSNYLRFLRNHVGVSTISLSLSSFDNKKNAEIIGMQNPVDIEWLCNEIKKYDFNLRLSINLTNGFDEFSEPKKMFEKCKVLGADQVTFRVMYTSGKNTEQDKWIQQNLINNANFVTELNEYIVTNGVFLEFMEFGGKRYSVDEMSVMVDDDCMSTVPKEDIKYLILRENCKLYSKWDDKGSLVF